MYNKEVKAVWALMKQHVGQLGLNEWEVETVAASPSCCPFIDFGGSPPLAL